MLDISGAVQNQYVFNHLTAIFLKYHKLRPTHQAGVLIIECVQVTAEVELGLR